MGGKASGRNESENLPCRLCFIQTPGKGFMDFFMQYRFLYLLCAFGALFGSFPLYAQEGDSLDYLLEDAVVLMQDRTEPENSLAPFRRIEDYDVARYGLQNVSEALRLMPGVFVQDYGGVGGLKAVSVRGLGAKHTAVSYDGVVVSDAQSGMVDLGRFALEDISEVTLVTGQDDRIALRTAREYSLASHVSMRSSLFSNDGYLSWRPGVVSSVKLQGGSFGLAGVSSRSSYRADDGRFAASLAGNYMRSDGMYPFTLVNGALSSREKRRDSDVESLAFDGNVRANVLEGSLRAKLYYYGSERGLPGAVNLYNKENRERLWNRNFFAQAVYDHGLSDNADIRAVVKYDRNYSRFKDVNKNYATGEQVDVNRQNEYYLSVAVSAKRSRLFCWSMASDISYATLENNFENSKAPRRFSSYTVFAASCKFKAVTIVGSLLATYINDEVKYGIASSPFKRLSPALSFSVKPISGYGGLMFRASFKDSYRMPTFADLYYLRQGNTALRPERATQYNVGVTWREYFALLGADSYVSVTADAYYNDVRDKIVALPTMYIWRMMNFGRADIFGADVSVSLWSRFAREYSLQADVAYSWMNAVDVTDKSAKNYRHQLPYTPAHTGNFSLTFENPVVDATYMLAAVGERYMLPQNTERNRMPGYVEHSFVLNRDFCFGDAMLHLQGKFMNLLNTHYEVIRYYPMQGFSFLFSAGVDF